MTRKPSFVTVATFASSSELAVIRAKLEYEGIETFVRDEILTQVVSFYSHAIGGIKLEVKAADEQWARQILQEAGIVKPPPEPSAFWLGWDKICRRLPYLRRMNPVVAFMVLMSFFVSLVVVLSLIIWMFPEKKKVAKNSPLPTPRAVLASAWYLKDLCYDDQQFAWYAISRLYPSRHCYSILVFSDDGQLRFPGIRKCKGRAKWVRKADSLYISEASGPDSIYNGAYNISKADYRLVLRSDRTIISASYAQ